MKHVLFFLLGILLCFGGCERDLTGPAVDVNGLQITSGADAFTIYNGTDEELHLFLVEQGAAAVISWTPYCLTTGTILQAGEKISVAYQNVYGYKTDCQVIVYWWACIESDGVLKPGEIQSVVVSTRPQ